MSQRAESKASARSSGGRLDAVVMRCAGDVEEMIPAAAVLVSESGVVVASGPPKPRPLSIGEWATVPGVRPRLIPSLRSLPTPGLVAAPGSATGRIRRRRSRAARINGKFDWTPQTVESVARGTLARRAKHVLIR